MLSPEGFKNIRSQTFHLEARGTKSIVCGQYGPRAKKAHCAIFCPHLVLIPPMRKLLSLQQPNSFGKKSRLLLTRMFLVCLTNSFHVPCVCSVLDHR